MSLPHRIYQFVFEILVVWQGSIFPLTHSFPFIRTTQHILSSFSFDMLGQETCSIKKTRIVEELIAAIPEVWPWWIDCPPPHITNRPMDQSTLYRMYYHIWIVIDSTSPSYCTQYIEIFHNVGVYCIFIATNLIDWFGRLIFRLTSILCEGCFVIPWTAGLSLGK